MYSHREDISYQVKDNSIHCIDPERQSNEKVFSEDRWTSPGKVNKIGFIDGFDGFEAGVYGNWMGQVGNGGMEEDNTGGKYWNREH